MGLVIQISGLTINQHGESTICLFSLLPHEFLVKNGGIAEADITGKVTYGAFVGQNFRSSVEPSSSMGNISGKEKAGSLVGYNYKSGYDPALVRNNYSTA